MRTTLHLIYSVLYILIIVGSWRVFKTKKYPHSLWLVIIAIGLFYDNAMIGLGAHIGVGSLLQLLSIPRFIAHALFTPSLMLTGLSIAHAKSLPWARKHGAIERGIHGLVITLVVIGIIDVGSSGTLVPACAHGIVLYTQHPKPTELCSVHSYSAADFERTSTPPIAAIVTIIVLIVMGVDMAWTVRSGWVLTGSTAMFILGRAPLWVSNGCELILLSTLLISFVRHQPRIGPAPKVNVN